jgi:tRNA threonylcarbamoyladenosine biosynthesis protein TsaB
LKTHILNIETSTNICSIAISENGALITQAETISNNYSSDITLLIQQCLNEANLAMQDLSAVAVSHGPGSYTSLRVGASVAKGICYALNIPLIAIDTLEALALAAFSTFSDMGALYCPMIDARRMEVYYAIWAKKSHSEWVCVEPLSNKVIEQSSFSNYISEHKCIYLCGNGASKCHTVMSSENVIFTDIICSASHLIPLSTEAFKSDDFTDLSSYTPQYFKAPNITTPKKVL